MTLDPYYVAARRVLLDALEDLVKHRDAVVVVGSQAVYLRTGHARIGVAEYTTDGDLVLISDQLADSPLLEEVMGERFEQSSGGQTGPFDPGVWLRRVAVNGLEIDIPIDLLVPEGIAPPGGTRGARLGPHGKRAARKTPGLEAAVVDNNKMAIPAVEQDDQRIIECKVAGPTALLVAKAHKIHDRLGRAEQRPDRLSDKDASDVYRLMLTASPEEVYKAATALLDDQRTAGPTRVGLERLRQQFGARRSPGVEMAVRSLRLGLPEDRIRTICVNYIAALQEHTTPDQ